ncbi:FUSC family protein [Streptomyces californicus]
MLRSMGEEVVGNNPVSRAAARLHEARRLDHDIVEVDASLRQAEESLTLNPRVRHGLLHRVVLRTGLDTLEICAVVVRVLSRTLTDLAKARTEEALFHPDVTELLQELFGRLAEAIESFARTGHDADFAADADAAEERLADALARSRATP